MKHEQPTMQTTQSDPTILNGTAASGHEVQLPTRGGMAMPSAPATSAAATVQPSTWKKILVVLHALRRRWFIGLSLGLGLGAAAAYGAWQIIPAPFTAYREVRIRSQIPHVLMKGASGRHDFNTYKQTQMKLARSRFVLTAALSDSKVARLPLLQEQENQIEWLEKELKIVAIGSEFFRISLSDPRRDDLVPIVNAVANAFKKEVVDKDVIAIERRITLYEKLRTTAEEKVAAFRAGLKEFNKSKAGGSERLTHQLDIRLEVNKRIRSAEREIRNMEVLSQLREKIKQKWEEKIKNLKIDDKTIDSYLARNEEYQAIIAKTGQEKRLLAIQKTQLTPNHPNLKETKMRLKMLNDDLVALRKKLRPEIAKRIIELIPQAKVKLSQDEILFRLDEQREHLKRAKRELAGIDQQLKNAGIAEVDFDEKEKEIDREESIEAALALEIASMRANRHLQDEEPRITIGDRTEISSRPQTKKRLMGTVLAGFGTFGLFLAGIVMLDVRMRRISSLQQLIDRVGLPVLGSVPTMPQHATSRKNGRWSARARYWHSVLTESINSARTFLIREAGEHSSPVIMIASALGSEGKTTISCHLATSLAKSGRNVLLVDGDMRRPFVHRTFDLPLGPGFAAVIRGEAQLEEAIQPSIVDGLSILPAGTMDEKTKDLLAQNRVGELLAGWRSQFDFIIIDSAPVLPVTDSLLIAQHVDGVLFTIRRDVSRAGRVMAACQRFSLLGVPLLGAIAIGLDDENYSYRYSYGYAPSPH